MRPGREVDTKVAQEVFGRNVWVKQKVLWENHPAGDRPLRKYSKEMEWAWEVVQEMKIALIPIDSGHWFAFIGPTSQGWASPTALLEKFQAGDFANCGASVHEEAPQAICEAALFAIEKRKGVSATTTASATLADVAQEVMQ